MTNKDYMDIYIGQNQEYYLSKWGQHENTFLKGWNWVPFFFCTEWLLYRKMYLEALIAIVVSMLIDIITYLFFPSPLQWGALVNIFVAIAGNGLYYQRYQRLLRKTTEMDEHKRSQYLREKGGTSWLAVGLAILVSIVIFIATKNV